MSNAELRAQCAELVDALENARRIIHGGDGTLHIDTAEPVLRRAYALLAQPTPELPTNAEAQALFDNIRTPIYGKIRAGDHFEEIIGYMPVRPGDLIRAALKIWGQCCAQRPKPLTDEAILDLAEEHEICYICLSGGVFYKFIEGIDMRDSLLSFARAIQELG